MVDVPTRLQGCTVGRWPRYFGQCRTAVSVRSPKQGVPYVEENYEGDGGSKALTLTTVTVFGE